MRQKKISTDRNIDKRAGDIVSSVFRSPVIKAKLKRYASFPFWTEIVGEDLANVSQPEKLIHNRILQVRVEDAAWAQELSFRKSEIVSRFNEFSTTAVIEDVKFTIGKRTNKGG